MTIQVGINVSKALGVAVLGPVDGLSITKALAVAVLQDIPTGVSISKAVAVAVVSATVAPTARPVLIICS